MRTLGDNVSERFSRTADKKRSRGANFSPAECDLLIQLVYKHRTMIENKTSDAATWKDKEKVWAELEQEFNSASGEIYRTVAALKAKYDTLKRETRRAAAKIHLYKHKTSGGSVPPLTPLQEDIHQLISLSVDSMESQFDTDASELLEVNINEIDIKQTMDPQASQNDQRNKFDQLVQPGSPTPLPSSATNEANNENWNKWNPKILRSKENPGLAPKKRPYELLAEKKIELVEKQRRILDEEEVSAAIKKVNEEKIQTLKLREYELKIESLLQDIRHKETMFNLKIKMMKEEHDLKMKRKELGEHSE